MDLAYNIALTERESALQANEYLALAPTALLRELAETATECHFSSGEFVYGRDEVARDLFVLLDGRVAYPEFIGWIKDDPDLRIVARRGQVFGFAGALLGHERRAVSAICEAPTRLLRVSGEEFARVCTAYGRSGVVEDLVRAHVRYERLGIQTGWQRLRGHQWRMSQAPLSQCLRPIVMGGICAVALPEAPDEAAVCWQLVLELTGAVALTGAEGGADPGADTLRATRAGERGESARRALTAVLERFDLGKSLDDEGRAQAHERLQLELLEAWFSGSKAVALHDRMAPPESALRERLYEFARGVGREMRATLYLGAADLDEALAVGDRVVLPGRDPSAQCVAIDLLGKAATADDRVRALRRAGRSRRQRFPEPAPDTVVAPSILTPSYAHPDAAALAAAPETRNLLWEYLQSDRFFLNIEFIPSHEKPLRGELERLVAIAGSSSTDHGLAGFSVTDRVHSDYDPDPVSAALYIKERCRTQPLVHLSGKGRDVYDLNESLCRVDAFGLQNVLLLTGDRLKNEPVGGPRARYLESVCAIQTARKAWPELRIGAALNPFKYREEDAMAQFLKLGKKIGAGVDFIITQLGYDMAKFDEARAWMDFRDYSSPLIANLMLLNAARGRWIRRQRVAGIVVSDSLQALLQEEERSLADKGRGRALQRLALQIVGLRMKGYRGVQLTGMHDHKQLRALDRQIEHFARECRSDEDWQRHWRNLHTAPESGQLADPAPSGEVWRWRADRPLHRQRSSTRYRLMDQIHSRAFDRGPLAHALGSLVGGIRAESPLGRLLQRVESAVKGPLFGCESCGMCRLAATQYICPETCPKGLANGPCGGTDANLCEFGDRECIHSRKYRLARDADVLTQLETWIIPPVPASRRGTASWPAHFSGDGPQIETVVPGSHAPIRCE